MAETTKIEWCHATFNPWVGCQKVHTGCKNCYAETLMDKRYGNVQWGPTGTRVRTSDANWRKPIAWNKAAAKAGERHRVFCASLADVFEDWRGPIVDHSGQRLFFSPDVDAFGTAETCPAPAVAATMADLRGQLFALIDQTPHLDWLLLTKRPENVRGMWPTEKVTIPGAYAWGMPIRVDGQKRLSNVWIGTSISDQPTADEYVPRLLECRDLAPVLFLSAEPLLAPVDIREYLGMVLEDTAGVDNGGWPVNGIDWVIVGGESGGGARACETHWISSIVSQTYAADVPVFIKQLGSCPRSPGGSVGWPSHVRSIPNQAGEIFGLRDKKGGDWHEWPEYIRFREFPVGHVAIEA